MALWTCTAPAVIPSLCTWPWAAPEGSGLAVRRRHKLRRMVLSPGAAVDIQPLLHEFLEVSLPCSFLEDMPGWRLGPSKEIPGERTLFGQDNPRSEGGRGLRWQVLGETTLTVIEH